MLSQTEFRSLFKFLGEFNKKHNTEHDKFN